MLNCLPFACGSVNPTFGDDQQAGDDDHRPTDQQRFVPTALMGEQCRFDRPHPMDCTGDTD